MNLYAVMNLFQESETLEAFERSLNDKENTINNLDLNGDNFVDYITVSDYVDDNVHNIVLRASLNQNEQQDIAVFVVEKLGNDAVQIQLIGDEALYGANYIVEPIYAETPNPGYSGNAIVSNSTYYELQPGRLSVIYTIPVIECGDLPGTGVIIPRTGVHGDLTTGTTIMDTIHTGIITIILITVTGIIIGAIHITPTIVTVYEYIVVQWL